MVCRILLIANEFFRKEKHGEYYRKTKKAVCDSSQAVIT